MDGQLSFYKHDAHMFNCFLPDFLFPGPLGFVPRTIAIATVTAAHALQVFSYQTLSVAGSGLTSGTRDTGKKFTVSIH